MSLSGSGSNGRRETREEQTDPHSPPDLPRPHSSASRAVLTKEMVTQSDGRPNRINVRASLGPGRHICIQGGVEKSRYAQLHHRRAIPFLLRFGASTARTCYNIDRRVFQRPIDGISSMNVSSHDFHRKFQVHILSLGRQHSSRSYAFYNFSVAFGVSSPACYSTQRRV